MKRALTVFLAVLVFMLLADCARRQDEPALREPDPSLVSGHTAGVVSRKSAIQVRFATEIAPEGSVGAEPADSPFSFSPRVRGRAFWADPRTLEFRPEQDLEPGTEYTATVRLDRLVETAGDQALFSFRFMVMRQSFTIELEGLAAPDHTDLERQELSGVLKTADVAGAAEVEKVLSASQHEGLSIRWSHYEDRRTHRFTVENILRERNPVPVILSWNGRSIGVNEKGARAVEVPPLGEFGVTGIKPVQTAERYLEVAFSDPLDGQQSLTGLIWVEGMKELRHVVRGGVVRVYSPRGWPEEVTVNVEPGIRNSVGGVLEQGVKSTAVFRRMLPRVRIPGSGVVLPTTQGLTIPIETVNLDGIVVEALRIYEDNVVQFLQVNALGGDQELRRVGKVVWKRELPIDWTPDRTNQWIRTGLDLSRLVSDNPRGMYRLRVYFRRDQVEYDCPEVTPEELESRFAVEYSLEAGEGSVWDSWEYDYDSYYEFYDNRENPCHPAYYRTFYDHHIVAARNIIVSDIGLTARMGTDRRMVVAASDLKTARPLPGVDLAVFDYQRRVLGRAVTGKNGLARIAMEREEEPFAVTASRDEQASYLKLDRGSALSVSHFDVGGRDSREGLKGFIYGDRGVWRPGDTLYLTFILYDPRGELPGDHPVQLSLLNPRGQVVERVTSTGSVGGFHHFPLRTDRDAPTGVWTARVAAGGA
ncbi:MAG: MG2 domain-containing protein, partial [Spirochaetota bacterium]